MPIAPARVAAFSALLKMERDEANSDVALNSGVMDPLDERDRGLAMALVMGVLRWRILLDDAWAARLTSSRETPPIEAITALRLGLYQLWFLDRVPAHAVLSDAVELTKRTHPGAARMVNAVLRKLTEVTPPSPDEAALAAHPRWLRDRWEKNYGAFAMRRMCVYDQQIPPVALRNFEEENVLTGAQPGKLLTRAAIVDSDPAAARDEGVRIQDEGSQLVAELAAAANPSARRVLDCCAAPGGKTAVIAQCLESAQIVALDISAQRLAMAEQRMPKKLRKRIEFRVGDARDLEKHASEERKYDLVLCDAPCSGTGTIARNPEIRTRLHEGDFARQASRQRAIFKGASSAVAPGGMLVYSTCSMEPEENEQMVEQFAERSAEFLPLACADLLAVLDKRGSLMPEALSLLDGAVRGNYLRTIPGLHPCDGFFVAAFKRAE